MSAILATAGAMALAYLLGSIPFGFLIARWVGQVDIRTKGSGNIGATNVGRVLGFRYFVVVFLLDFFKGYLPTAYLPREVALAIGLNLPELPVLVAVGAILGHNFPITLKFRGGKGVATTLGAVFALDVVASSGSAIGFVCFLLLTRFVSMSSILGGVVWLIVHFSRVETPLARDQIAMTIASGSLMTLLVVRHRQNLARIWAGTEPRINLRKKKQPPGRPSGRVATVLVAVLALFAGASAFVLNASRTYQTTAGPYLVREVDRVATGHQRAERLAFANQGQLLAATCPRYGRVMLYRVTPGDRLELVRDIELAGRPVALGPSTDRIYVLVRPHNDARHVQEGWWETFDFAGNPVGPRKNVGYYPDDLVLTRDGSHALVLTSGRGEGGSHRPAPAVTIYDLMSSDSPRVVGQVRFDQPGDDPARLALAVDDSKAAVSIQGTNSIAWLDLSDLTHPRQWVRRSWSKTSTPDAIRFDGQGGILAVDEVNEALWYQAGPDLEPEVVPIEGGLGEVVEITGKAPYWAMTCPFDSSVALAPANPRPDEPLARLPLKGRANLASTRPLGIAYEPRRSLLAVANRSGGSLHLIALQADRMRR